MAKKLLFVYNPKAGKAQIRLKLADILDIFAAADYEITVAPTRRRGDARNIVRERSEEYELVVCSGGDGTLDEAVTGMMQSGFRTPIGYIPAGSTNDFGGSLALPKNMVRAAETAVYGTNFPCDIGSFNKDVFVYIAAFGLFTEVSYETAQDVKNVLGHMAYLLEGMKRLSSIRSYQMKVTHDGETVEDDFIFGSVCNSTSLAGLVKLDPNRVRMDDGVFELVLLRMPRTVLDLTNLLVSLKQMQYDDPGIFFRHASHVTVETRDDIPWSLDGEYAPSAPVVNIVNCHGAIELLVRRPEEDR